VRRVPADHLKKDWKITSMLSQVRQAFQDRRPHPAGAVARRTTRRGFDSNLHHRTAKFVDLKRILPLKAARKDTGWNDAISTRRKTEWTA